MLNEIIIPMIVSLVVTVICNRLLAIYTFKVIDTYIKGLVYLTPLGRSFTRVCIPN